MHVFNARVHSKWRSLTTNDGDALGSASTSCADRSPDTPSWWHLFVQACLSFNARETARNRHSDGPTSHERWVLAEFAKSE